MTWFIGHLVGDFLFQNDWMANNKKQHTWPCLVHVSFYTFAVMLFTWLGQFAGYEPWPWWAALVVFIPHFLIDRTNVVKWSMDHKGQKNFAVPPMAPWSIIAVDNTWHLVCLFFTEILVVALA